MQKDNHVDDARAPEAASADQRALRSAKDDLLHDLEALRSLWVKSQTTRDRSAIYPFLDAVFELVTIARRKGMSQYLAKKATKLSPSAYLTSDLFMAVIHCATPVGAVQSRTRSKWARALGYAEQKKSVTEPLQTFVQHQGGINECASRFRRGKMSRANIS